MAFLLEDGTGVDGANAYVTETELGTYTDDRSITLATGDAEAAIIRATNFIDSTYRQRFVGYRTHGRDQGLEWPRTGVLDAQYFPINGNEIPTEIKFATCEAAIRELTDPGSMTADLERGGAIKLLKAGSVEIEYGANASAVTTYRIIDGILSGLLGAIGPTVTAVAIRG